MRKIFVSITLTDEKEEPYMPKEQLEPGCLTHNSQILVLIMKEHAGFLDLYEEEEETESLFESFASFFETVQGRRMNGSGAGGRHRMPGMRS